MKPERAWRGEWAVLVERRATARLRWRRAAAGLSERIRDPLGLGSVVRRHPVASAGIGAAAGALLGGLLFRAARGRGKDGRAAGEGASPPPPSRWADLLRDAALGVAVPWLLRTLGKEFAGTGDAGSATPPPPSPPVRDADGNGDASKGNGGDARVARP